MGGKEVEKTTTPQDIIDYLNDLFAYALSIGMTYKQYWHDDPLLLRSYLKAEEYRQIRRNNEFWLQGLYVHIAIGDLVPVLNPFSKEHKARKYLDKPIPITRKEQEDEQAKQLVFEKKVEAYMNSLVGKKLGG